MGKTRDKGSTEGISLKGKADHFQNSVLDQHRHMLTCKVEQNLALGHLGFHSALIHLIIHANKCFLSHYSRCLLFLLNSDN
jgi:hypothetical protein